MGKILVTGGCGYIGSHTLVDLIESGYEVISLDSLVNSSDAVLDAIKDITGTLVVNHRIDLVDKNALAALFEAEDIDGIIHFAALKNVGESVQQPLRYHRNNVVGLLNLIELQQKHEVQHFIFSSSCSVYGNTDQLPVTEDTPMAPAESPYGRTKQICEGIITDVAGAYSQMKFINLRYFNPAGAHPTIKMGESPINTALNLVPIITETGIGKRESITVHGDDYDSRDGSCVRDYIHVMDLARAHTLSYQFITSAKMQGNLEVFNLGSGAGSTVLEAITAFEAASGVKLNYQIGPRREGDVVAIYADHNKATELLSWQPKYTMQDIMQTAWEWEVKRSDPS